MAWLAETLAIPGLGWIVLAAIVAGLVRGFSGFGTAMIYLPVAGQLLSPFEALTTLVVMDLIGPLPNVPRAIRDGHPGDVARLGVGLFIAFPAGIALLAIATPEVFRYAVSAVALLLLAALLSGFRYRGRVTPPMVYGVGLGGGLLGGVSGIPGPPVILFYMASPHPPAVIRANNLLYLVLADVALLLTLSVGGFLETRMLLFGAILAVPYLLANIVGAAIFRPGAERTYRLVAYAIIAVSAVRGLPLFN